MSIKRIELINDLDLELSLTMNGIGAIIAPDNEAPSFSEYTWDDILKTLIDSHTIAVLRKNDVRISGSSKEFLTRVAEQLRSQASKIEDKLSAMEVINES
tara:strand:+ start:2115 stop:2414 length:300 start_codon:yes stop_codon:yes gene_type:complete